MADDDGDVRDGGLTVVAGLAAAGLAKAGPPAYFAGMDFFTRMSPLRAYRDLRRFLATRERYEFGFLALAMAITGFLIYAFYSDSRMPREYKRDIVYVEQWPVTRSNAEIRAQQAIDAPIKARALAAQKAARDKKQAEFKKVDDQLTRWGL